MFGSRSFVIPVAAVAAVAACSPDVEQVDIVDIVDAGPRAPGVIYAFEEGCPSGKVEDIPYYYPLRDGAEFIDISYMDSPNGDSPQTYPVGVRYDFHRDDEGSTYDDDIHTTAGFRDYMGSNDTYNAHNGYDNSISPGRVVVEGGGLVYPMAPGTVTFVTDYEWPQATIGVKHANGFNSQYTHLRWGSAQVRVGDRVDRRTPLGQLDGSENTHLHYSLHDCSAFDEPSYYEVFRADRHLMALKPLYDSNPSDASDLVVTAGTAGQNTHDTFRFRRGEGVNLMGTGQWRTYDLVKVQLVDPNGGIHGVSQATNTNLGRGIWFQQFSSYTIGTADPIGYWSAQILVNGAVRVSKHFHVTAAGSTPDANGQVQSAAAVVSSGSDNVRVYYRTNKNTLFSFDWRARKGWGYMTHSGPMLAGAPSCVQRDAMLVDCFYKGSDDKMHRWASTDGGNIGTDTIIYSESGAGDPGAFSSGPTSLEVAFADNGTLSLLHFDGTSFAKTTSGEKVAQPPSCVVEDAKNWLCYAKAVTGELREITVVNGTVTGASTAPLGSQWSDVQALLLPQPLDQKSHVVVVDTAGGAMRHRTQVRYQTGAPKWMAFWDGTIGASELSTPPHCVVHPGMAVPECFAADLDHNLVRTAWTGTRWMSWEPIIASAMDRQAPTLVALGGDRLDAFYAAKPDTQSVLLQRTQTGNMWSAEQSLVDGDLSFAPSCAARGGQIDCFTVTATGAIARRIFDGASWTIQAPLAVAAASSVSAVALSSANESAMFLDSAGNLIERGLTATSWSGGSVVIGKPAGTKLVDAPGCTMRSDVITKSKAIACFARTDDGRLAEIMKTGSAWSAWSFVPNAAPRSAPSAVSASLGIVDVFFRSADNVLVQVTRAANGTWSDPAILGGSIASAPSCAARTSPTRIDCIAQGFRSLSQDVVHYSYQATIGWVLPRGLATALANLALHKPATQSSEYAPAPAPASRAVDGTIDGNFNNGSVTHTDNTTAGWWQVDLGAIRSIDHVQVFNRTDAAVERLAGFKVLVSDNGFSWSLGLDPGTDFDRTSPIPFPGTYMPMKKSGRFVRVLLLHPEYLHLAEVMVMGQEH